MKKRGSEEKLDKLLVDFTESLTGGASQRAARKIDSLTKETDTSFEDSVSSLFETVRTISSVIHPEQASEELIARVSYAVQERLQEQISTEKLQRIIGMAVTVEDFRKSLFHDIVAACRGVGLSLTPKEIAALRSLKEDAVEEFANSLDERITKFFPTNLP